MNMKIDDELFINNDHLSIHYFDVDRNVTSADDFIEVLFNHGISQVINNLQFVEGWSTYHYMYITYDNANDAIPASVSVGVTATPLFTLTITDYTQLLGFCRLFGDSKGTQIFLEDWITRDGNIIRAGAYAI